MVEISVLPENRIVTILTGGREACTRVIGISGVIVIIFVAEETLGGGAAVLVFDMAIRAVDLQMRSGQGPASIIVAPVSRFPACGCVAIFAGDSKTSRSMIRCNGVVIVILMTGETGGRGIGISTGMAVDTARIQMLTGQGKTGLIMIEVAGSPGIQIMTDPAILRVVPGAMIRILNVQVVRFMTGPTIIRCAGVDPLQVAQHTGDRLVGSLQGKIGVLVMVERGW